MKAKLINGILTPYKQPENILGDASRIAKKEGYKEVIYQEGDKGIYEDEKVIYVETPAYVETDEDIKQKRKQAYKSESDDLFMEWQKYIALSQSAKATAAKTAWIAKVTEIDQKHPYKK